MSFMSSALARVLVPVCLVGSVLLGTAGAGSIPSASADTRPRAGESPTVSADVLPTVQVNGVVWAQVTVGNTVYATGQFTSSRPAGAAAGTNETPAGNLIAYDIRTGDRVAGFTHTLNSPGLAIAASPDGRRVYVGGNFNQVDGRAINRIAAFDVATGALVPSFAPRINASVQALAATNSTIYAGGSFTSANESVRTRLAAFDTTSALRAWAPTADRPVRSLVVSPSGSRVIVGGSFDQLNGVSRQGIGAISATDGSSATWPSTFPVKIFTTSGAINSLTTDGRQVFGTAFGGGGHSTFEGRFAINPETGALNWANDCHGDSYGSFPVGDTLYSVGHTHDCTAIGAFPDYQPSYMKQHRALAESTTPTTVNTGPDNYGWNYAGIAATKVKHWFPDLANGAFTGQNQAAWAITGNQTYVAVGGGFPSINGVRQQGLARFAVRSAAPNKTGIVLPSLEAPTVTAPTSGGAQVRWNTAWDYDNEMLTYEVLRDAEPTPVHTTTIASNFWQRPSTSFTDTTAGAGTHSYKIRVKDPDANQATGASASATVSTAATPTSTTNLALGKPSTISMPYPGYNPSLAVDGNPGTSAHSQLQDKTWWQVDLQRSSEIGSIKVWGRTDCCTERLTDYWVLASDTPFDTRLSPAEQAAKAGVWSNRQQAKPAQPTTIDVPAGVRGRYVMIQLNRKNYLSLGEVEVRAPSSVNTAPAAVATKTCTELRCAFSGAGSSDADGTIASYRWDFGDGTAVTTSASPSTTHTYARAGTYRATLTVTDDRGATATTTISVVAGSPPTETTPQVVASDTFDRTVTRWGSADIGGTWTYGSAGPFSTNDATGAISLTAGSGPTAQLASVSARDVDARLDVSIDKAAVSTGSYTSLLVRQNGTSDYRARIVVAAGGKTSVQVIRTEAGVATTLARAAVPSDYQVGDVLRLRLQATGSSTTALKATVWKVGSTEPATPQVTTTDATASLQAAGAVGVAGYLGKNETNAPVVLGIDNLRVTTPRS